MPIKEPLNIADTPRGCGCGYKYSQVPETYVCEKFGWPEYCYYVQTSRVIFYGSRFPVTVPDEGSPKTQTGKGGRES